MSTVTSEQVFAEICEGFGSGAIDDPYPLFAQWRRETPVRPGDVMAEFGMPSFVASGGERPAVTLLRYEDIAAGMRDGETFSSRIWAELLEPLFGFKSILGMEGEEHRRIRGMLKPVFARGALTVWNEEVVVPAARHEAEAFVRSGARRGDLVEYALRFPMRMVYEILGLRTDEPAEVERFQTRALELLLAIPVSPDPERMTRNVGRAVDASNELMAALRPVVERTRAQGAPGNDLIGHMIRAEFEGERFTDEQIAQFIIPLMQPTETTGRLFLNTMTCLLDRPELLAAVQNDRTLVMPAINEAERYEGPALVTSRIATRDVEVSGTLIPEGAAVVMALGAGNRDPEAFADPDTFAIDRKGPQALAFGLGQHLCTGMNFARYEIRAAIEALLDALPNVRLDPDRDPPRIRGTQFRSPSSLPVVWD